MILKSDDCRKIMDLVKVFDKDFKNNKKGIFVFKNNFVLFDLYKAVIIKTSENVKKEYMFELTNEMVKGFAKYSDIALFEDLDVLQIVIDDKKKTQIICKPLSENDKIVPISSLKRTLERNLGQDDFLELKLELTDKEFTNDLEIMLEIEKLIKERKMIIKNGITYSFEISSQNKIEFNFFNSVETDDVSEVEKKEELYKFNTLLKEKHNAEVVIISHLYKQGEEKSLLNDIVQIDLNKLKSYNLESTLVEQLISVIDEINEFEVVTDFDEETNLIDKDELLRNRKEIIKSGLKVISELYKFFVKLGFSNEEINEWISEVNGN